MLKRGLVLAVAALLALGLTSPALGQVNPFRDVPIDHWAYDAITRLQKVNLVEGYPDGTFGGDRTFTRYEMAMVFARTLARLEQLLDQRIVDHVSDLQAQIDELRALREQDLADTMAAIQKAREELAAQVGAAAPGAPGAAGPAGAPGEPGAAGAPGEIVIVERDTDGELQLTPEAQRVIERVITERIQDAMAELPQRTEVVERITEVVQERNGEAIRRAVDEAVAEELRRQGIDSGLADAAARGDVDALRQAVAQLRDGLSGDVERLAAEFRHELDLLGARVADLERLFGLLSDRVAWVEEATDRVARDLADWKADRKTKFSGSIGVDVDVRGTRGPAHDRRYGGVAAYLRDPRHSDRDKQGDIPDDDMVFAGQRVRQLFNLTAETPLSDESQLVAKLALFNDSINRVRLDGGGDETFEGLGVDSLEIALSGPEGTGSVYYGLLDEDHVSAEGFNRYILDPDRFIEPDPARKNHRGTALVGTYGNFRGTALTVSRAGWEFPTPSPREPRGDGDEERRDFATAPGRRYAASAAADLGATWEIHGGIAVHHPDEGGRSDTLASVGVGGPITQNLRFHALGARDGVHEVWAYEAGLGATLGSVDAQLTYGDIGKGFGQTAKDIVGDDDVRPTFLGNDELSHNHRWLLGDVSTPFLGGDLRGRYFQADRHDSTAGKDSRVARADYGVDFRFLLPLRLDAAFASGKVDRDAASQEHTKAKLGWEGQQLLERLTWDGSIELIRGWDVKKASHWDDPARWEKKDKTTFDTTLTWTPWDPVAIYGGYKNVNTTNDPSLAGDKKENIYTAGIDYGIGLSQWTKLTVGYELQKADVKVAAIKEDRTDRHTIRAAIDQAVGNGGNLRLEGKRISGAGGDGQDKNDAVDYVASLEVRLPVAQNVFFNVSGHYVDSRGNADNGEEKDLRDYTATEVRAALALQF